ncbi:uncharacterized protein LOC123503982 [Portunus trituberculatus]|uniref:uncharacterized protein LOC123503982 n=1 Tax=Portunus trituberculatus TaxID=210409 RepID=UPI001E1CFD04|nr:uncharacterized protein LOC123503982 [Portunus trituberculatus]
MKKALVTAFTVDQYVVYDRLSAGGCTLESSDVYLAPQHWARLLGVINDKVLSCAFVSRLPEEVRHLLRAGSCTEALYLDQILTWARVVIKNDPTCVIRNQPGCHSETQPLDINSSSTWMAKKLSEEWQPMSR